MRSRAIVLVLAALPLAVMTVRDTNNLLLSPPARQGPKPVPPIAEVVNGVAVVLEEVRPVLGALDHCDIAAPQTLPELESLASENPFSKFAASWSRWVAVRRWAEEYLAAEALAAGNDVASLSAARTRLEELRGQLEQLRPLAVESLAAALQGRVDQVAAQIDRMKMMAGVAGLLEECRSAWRAGRYQEVEEKGEQFTSQYAIVAAPEQLEEVRSLVRQARFQLDRQELQAKLQAAKTLEEREAALVWFLEKYPDNGQRNAEEQAVVQSVGKKLEEVRAHRDFERCKEQPPGALETRLACAAQIARQRIPQSLRQEIQAEAARWLEEALPRKKPPEDESLQEAETTEGEIVRGYFVEVTMPDGKTGYKRYDTLAALQNPVSDVGTCRAEDFRTKPGPSLPRRMVAEYNDRRLRVLRQPGRKEVWVELRDLCKNLEEQIHTYRRKPGSSSAEFSFDQEIHTIESILLRGSWSNMEAIWGEQ